MCLVTLGRRLLGICVQTWTEETRVPTFSPKPVIVCVADPIEAKGIPSVIANSASERAAGRSGIGWLIPLVDLRNAQKKGEERVTASVA